MPDKPYLFPSNNTASCPESGFSLVEVMVAMAILMIAAVSIGYVLVSSNQQLATVEYALQNQQYGMQATLAGATGSTTSVGIGVQSQPQTVNVTITTTPPSQPQVCTSMMSMMINMMLCFFGSCGNTQTPSASSVVVQVPTASLSSSFSALPSNQQPPAWWQP
ncbi:prepilin-type N-terminal cleavage/methylation domain-containing protein [Acidithiobacillus ferrooxidans]|jgi:prepilin-type N-terminal cleavage/methylation domain-containing protein|uniref:prepilin-type N-terminal cleavage/methylation domain-containing protein n=1 Tax=Acidithiobacillus ferrooxidans TaxID=920 RepID=UPI0013D5CBD9|nr:prepilin-type N-terminal cleavage/methylation domain-containing protein [Acidithiobacillus ferrooxidans]MBU2857637.1 prepilin-type N-terminal cleavage/methylation domain-containing protein [Acidithiobacillus ferrooxidans]MBU2858973.1 prepilin-type N-terminal cleavage/methylation domain-containing protein [Acidithiobacillus ferrooxidans]MCR2829259.1 prepilin-type N-terminal cleavage/methylation domain-containing protein [Acidithiobacillus ferrooxidans]MDA8153418.1 prepilin-type N-terminal cle